MGIMHLCLIFGVTPSVCSRTITAMLSLVVQKLKIHPWARVKFPDVDQMASFVRQIKSHEPEVDDVIGFMDVRLDLGLLVEPCLLIINYGLELGLLLKP
jgi:hypothetical protein